VRTRKLDANHKRSVGWDRRSGLTAKLASDRAIRAQQERFKTTSCTVRALASSNMFVNKDIPFQQIRLLQSGLVQLAVTTRTWTKQTT
jgi:hypothetical protein